MYIFSKDGDTFVNSDNVKCFEVTNSGIGISYDIMADEVFLGDYGVKSDAVKALNDIFRLLENGMATSYQLK